MDEEFLFFLKSQQDMALVDYNITYIQQQEFDSNREFIKFSQFQLKEGIKKQLLQTYPNLNDKQIYSLISIYQNETCRILSANLFEQSPKKNILLDDKYTFGSLKQLQFQNHVIVPNDFIVPDSEAIQCFLTKFQSSPSNSFIMFLFILKQIEAVLPVCAVKLIKQFVTEKPYNILDIGREKKVLISLYSDDNRNILNINDELIIGDDLIMKVLSVKSVRNQLIDSKLEVNLKNFQTILKQFQATFIGIAQQVEIILRYLLEANLNEVDFQHQEFYQAFLTYPLLIIDIQNIKTIAIFGSERQQFQFGNSSNLPLKYRIQHEQVDNYQFHIIYNNDQWRIYDGKQIHSNNQVLKSKFGTWKKTLNQMYQLLPSDNFRINSNYFNINQMKQENQQKKNTVSCFCSVIWQDVSEIPDIQVGQKSENRIDESYQSQDMTESQLFTSEYGSIQLKQHFYSKI